MSPNIHYILYLYSFQGDQPNVGTTSDDVDISMEEGSPSEGKDPEIYGEGSVCVYCQYCKVIL